MPLPATGDFDLFQGRTWLDCAHQGPMPLAAIREAQEALTWKMWPHLLSPDRFREVPARLRKALAQLIDAHEEDVILGNSASYGLHLLAGGLPMRAGDEVLLVRGDFPASHSPWLPLQERGINVRLVTPRRPWIGTDELRRNLIPTTKVLCLSWVSSFTGWVTDLADLASLCRERGVILVVNAAQGLGARAFSLRETPVDALVGVGFKWLCGPYGTGFCWIDPELRERMNVQQNYWLAGRSAQELAEAETNQETPPLAAGPRRFDVFGTANFFNFKPLSAAVELLLSHGIVEIESHNRELRNLFCQDLDRDRYQILDPPDSGKTSALVCFSHREPGHNATLLGNLRREGFDLALRRGRLRLSPHLYNTRDHIEALLRSLRAWEPK